VDKPVKRQLSSEHFCNRHAACERTSLMTDTTDVKLSDDLIIGARNIALYLFGDEKYARRVYHLAETSKNSPFFKMGSRWAARKSELDRKWRGAAA
jgi:hypothetical protein